MKLVNLLLAFALFLMISGVGVVILLESLNTDVGIEKVPCYDRYGNLIEGLICDDETTVDDKNMMVFMSIILMIIGVFGGRGLYKLLDASLY